MTTPFRKVALLGLVSLLVIELSAARRLTDLFYYFEDSTFEKEYFDYPRPEESYSDTISTNNSTDDENITTTPSYVVYESNSTKIFATDHNNGPILRTRETVPRANDDVEISTPQSVELSRDDRITSRGSDTAASSSTSESVIFVGNAETDERRTTLDYEEPERDWDRFHEQSRIERIDEEAAIVGIDADYAESERSTPVHDEHPATESTTLDYEDLEANRGTDGCMSVGTTENARESEYGASPVDDENPATDDENLRTETSTSADDDRVTTIASSALTDFGSAAAESDAPGARDESVPIIEDTNDDDEFYRESLTADIFDEGSPEPDCRSSGFNEVEDLSGVYRKGANAAAPSDVLTTTSDHANEYVAAGDRRFAENDDRTTADDLRVTVTHDDDPGTRSPPAEDQHGDERASESAIGRVDDDVGITYSKPFFRIDRVNPDSRTVSIFWNDAKREVKKFFTPGLNYSAMIFEGGANIDTIKFHIPDNEDCVKTTISLNENGQLLCLNENWAAYPRGLFVDIEIPAQKNLLDPPTVVAIANANGVRRLIWKVPETVVDVRNISVWSYAPGENSANFHPLPPNATSFVTTEKIIGLRVDSASSTSAIVPISCEIAGDRIAAMSSSNVRYENTPTHLIFSWPLQCPQLGEIRPIRGYVIKYCTYDPENGLCSEDRFVHFNRKDTILNATISDLTPDTVYGVQAAAVTGFLEMGPLSDIVYMRTMELTPEVISVA